MTTNHETLFIGGEWVPPSSAATIEVHNASTGEHIGTVPDGPSNHGATTATNHGNHGNHGATILPQTKIKLKL